MRKAGRRNLTPHQLRLLRGERYERLKGKTPKGGKRRGAGRPGNQSPEKLEIDSEPRKYATAGHRSSGVADRLAKEHKVSEVNA